MEPATVRTLLVLAGWGQIAIVLASAGVPRALGWRAELARVRPLTRQVFWTYAGYIAGTNLALGLVTALAPEWLLAPSGLALSVCAFGAAWWGARIVLQFVAFDRAGAPQGAWVRAGEAGLVALFALAFAAYAAACWLHLAP